jgi:hypothetical protein
MNRLSPLIAALLLCACGSKPDPDAATLNMRDVPIEESGMYPRLSNGAEESVEEAEPEKPQIALEKWSQPDLEHVRYQKVEDQAGCQWWMPFPGSEDEDGPDPVLGRDHRPICRDSYQEPDAEIVYLDEEEAAKEIAAGTAVKATAAALKRAEGGDEEETAAEEGDEDAEPEPEAAPTSSPTPKPIASTGTHMGQPLITTRGGMATSMGSGLAMTSNGKLAIQMGGMAMPIHH